MGFTRRLAEYAQGYTGSPNLPPEVAERAKEMMINAAAVALAAAAQPDSRTLTRFVQDMQGNGRCTIIGMGLRSSPMYAALVNGAMVHLLDFDDEIAARGIHPSGAVFPVVMALGEMNGSPGVDVLAAYVLGCEVIAKLEGRGGRRFLGHNARGGAGWNSLRRGGRNRGRHCRRIGTAAWTRNRPKTPSASPAVPPVLRESWPVGRGRCTGVKQR